MIKDAAPKKRFLFLKANNKMENQMEINNNVIMTTIKNQQRTQYNQGLN